MSRIESHDGVGDRLKNLREIVWRTRWDDDDVAFSDLPSHPTLHAGTRPARPRHHASKSRVLTRLRVDQTSTGDQGSRTPDDGIHLSDFAVDGTGDNVRRRAPMDERDANMMAMRDLVRPDGLGAFKVLVQEKGSGVGDPPRLSPDAGLASGLPVPLLGAGHIRLLEGRYPDAIWHRLLRR